MDIHIIQHGLRNLRSHFFNETLAWRETVSDLGFGWNCYAHVTLSPDLRRQTDTIPAFRFVPDGMSEPDPRLAPLADFIDAAESFTADCERFLQGKIRGDDLIFVPYATEREMFGAALWLGRQDVGARPRLAFIVHRPDWDWIVAEDRRGFKGDARFWRYAGKRLAAVTNRVTPFIGARDPRLQHILQNLLGMPVQHVPMSTFMRNLPVRPSDVPKAFDLGMVGQFRAERGSVAIPEILARIAANHRHFRFLLQVDTDDEKHRIIQRFANADAAGSVEIAVGGQSIEQFYLNVARCRVLVLPYVPWRYRMRSSGVLSVAAGLGVPVIVPNHTWLSDRIEDATASGFVYDDLTENFLQRVLTLPQSHWDMIERTAAGLAQPWRQRNSTCAVLGEILAFFERQNATQQP